MSRRSARTCRPTEFLHRAYREHPRRGRAALRRRAATCSPTPTRCRPCSTAPPARTAPGLLAALLLGSLGVAHDDIVEDYALTQATMDRFLAVVATEDPEAARAIADTPASFFMADPAAMSLVLTDLEREHGSIAGYVAHDRRRRRPAGPAAGAPAHAD